MEIQTKQTNFVKEGTVITALQQPADEKCYTRSTQKTEVSSEE